MTPWMDPNRCTGRTTQQLMLMPDQSAFVTSDGIRYVYDLCGNLGGKLNLMQSLWTKRDGSRVVIIHTNLLKGSQVDMWRGRRFNEIEPDHAVRWDDEISRGYAKLLYWCLVI